MATITTRKNANGSTSFLVRWRDGGGRDGKRESCTLPTKRSAQAFKRAVEEAGERRPPEPEQPRETPTLSTYAETFLTTRTGIEERTRHDYAAVLRRHVLPQLGAKRLDGIDRVTIRAFLVDLEKPGKLSAKSIRSIHALLSSVLNDAVENGHLPANPARGIRLPRRDADGTKATFLTPAEFDLVRDALKSDVARDLVTVLAGTGMRWGEVTALHVRDVDLLAPGGPRLRVEHAVKRLPDSSFIVGKPKTPASRRTITLDPRTVDALLPHLAAKSGHELVFPNGEGKPLLHGNFAYRCWAPAIRAAQALGLEKTPRIHDLRHSHVSWLIAAGVPLPKIKQRLGHTSITTTVDRYGHLSPEDDLGVLAAVTAALTVG